MRIFVPKYRNLLVSNYTLLRVENYSAEGYNDTLYANVIAIYYETIFSDDPKITKINLPLYDLEKNKDYDKLVVQFKQLYINERKYDKKENKSVSETFRKLIQSYMNTNNEEIKVYSIILLEVLDYFSEGDIYKNEFGYCSEIFDFRDEDADKFLKIYENASNYAEELHSELEIEYSEEGIITYTIFSSKILEELLVNKIEQAYCNFENRKNITNPNLYTQELNIFLMLVSKLSINLKNINNKKLKVLDEFSVKLINELNNNRLMKIILDNEIIRSNVTVINSFLSDELREVIRKKLELNGDFDVEGLKDLKTLTDYKDKKLKIENFYNKYIEELSKNMDNIYYIDLGEDNGLNKFYPKKSFYIIVIQYLKVDDITSKYYNSIYFYKALADLAYSSILNEETDTSKLFSIYEKVNSAEVSENIINPLISKYKLLQSENVKKDHKMYKKIEELNKFTKQLIKNYNVNKPTDLKIFDISGIEMKFGDNINYENLELLWECNYNHPFRNNTFEYLINIISRVNDEEFKDGKSITQLYKIINFFAFHFGTEKHNYTIKVEEDEIINKFLYKQDFVNFAIEYMKSISPVTSKGNGDKIYPLDSIEESSVIKVKMLFSNNNSLSSTLEEQIIKYINIKI